MVAQFQLSGQQINIYQLEHFVTHALSELYSKRNDGWVEEHYKKELIECGAIIDDYLQNLNEDKDETIDWVKNQEKEKLINLRKKINEVQS